jgi:hypothetical protein
MTKMSSLLEISNRNQHQIEIKIKSPISTVSYPFRQEGHYQYR